MEACFQKVFLPLILLPNFFSSYIASEFKISFNFIPAFARKFSHISNLANCCEGSVALIVFQLSTCITFNNIRYLAVEDLGDDATFYV